MIQSIIKDNKVRLQLAKGILGEVLLLYWNITGTDSVTLDWRGKNYRPVGASLDFMVAVAWFIGRRGKLLRFKRPSYAMWRYFENDALDSSTNKLERKSRPSKEVAAGYPVLYLARFISSEYGHKVITRLSIKEDFQKSANEWFASHIKGDWVAVHYRGTDVAKIKDVYKKRYKIDLKPYVTYLKEALGSQCSIFACSDQAQFIDEMKAVFPGRVFARDIKRSCDDRAIHKHTAQCKEQDIYDQERDALIDVLVLAKAELIYTTGSGLVDVVRYFNPETKIVSLDGRTIGRGKNNAPIPEPDLFERLSLP